MLSKKERIDKEAQFWVLMAKGSTLTAACEAVEGTLNIEQVLSAELDLSVLRKYCRVGVPAMLRERRPELYGDLLAQASLDA